MSDRIGAFVSFGECLMNKFKQLTETSNTWVYFTTVICAILLRSFVSRLVGKVQSLHENKGQEAKGKPNISSIGTLERVDRFGSGEDEGLVDTNQAEQQEVLGHVGVMQVYPAAGNDVETDVDIFAIHGLDTTSPDTWTFQHKLGPQKKGDKQKKGVNWLTCPDMLSHDLPKARIFTCNWPSRLYRDPETIEMTISELAHALLSDIQSERSRLGAATNRPVVFVASCLGGIVLVKALTLAAGSDSAYEDLLAATAGVVFLGTPFRGTALADLFGIAILRLEAGGFFKSQSLSRGLLDNLGKSTPNLEELVNHFTKYCCAPRNLPVYCFYETIKSDFVAKSLPKQTPEWLKKHIAYPKLLVDSSSARLDVAKESIPLDVTHVMMNKFPGRDDTYYKRVRGTIQALIERALSLRSQTLGFTGEDARCWALLTEKIPSAGHELEAIESRKERLIPSCSRWVLKCFDWHRGPDTSVIHLVGGPGTGKTMAMINLIRYHLTDLGQRTVSYFFFEGKSKTECALYRGLIYHLIRNIRNINLISHLRQELESGSDNAFDDAMALRSMLERIISEAKPSLLFVDGLDECQDKHQLRHILGFIHETALQLGTKWVIASRPDSTITGPLQSLGKKCLVNSVDLSTALPATSISEYIHRRVSILADTKEYGPELRENIRRVLDKRSEGIFLWVSLVCEVLQNDDESWNDSETLRLLEGLPTGLPDIYNHILSKLRELQVRWNDCAAILATTVTAERPLHLEELASIAYSDRKLQKEEAKKCVQLCSNFLVLQAEVVHFIHQSAKDFLKDDPEGDIFHHGICDRNRIILFASLRTMKDLRENIYDLKHPSMHIADITTPPSGDPLLSVTYSCESWIYHLIAAFSDLGDRETYSEILGSQGEIFGFMSRSLLSWLEALCLKRVLYKGLAGIRRLESFLHKRETGELYGLVQDTTRFILMHMSIIESTPLQIYSSALLFSPRNNMIRSLFLPKDYPVKVTLGLDYSWERTLQTFKTHLSPVMKVAVSSCGARLASGHLDGTIQVWDIARGRVELTYQGSSGEVKGIAFSPDGSRLAVSNCEYTETWNIATSQVEWSTPCSLPREALTVWPDGNRLIVASSHGIVLILNAATGRADKLLEISLVEIWSLSFWHEGNQLIVGSSDGTVQLLDVATGQIKQSFKGEKLTIQSLAISADESKLASSHNTVIHLWNIATGQVEQTLSSPNNSSIMSLVFWPDGSKLASAYFGQGAIWIRDTAEGKVLQLFKGHTYNVNSLVFSPDKKRLISGSGDGTIRIWDATAIQTEPKFLGHASKIDSLVFSPDGKQLASASDNVIQVHEVVSGVLMQRLARQSHQIKCLAFSSDGLKLASGSFDETVQVWHMTKRRVEQTFRCSSMIPGLKAQVFCLAFSADGTKLAAYVDDNAIRIWDVIKGNLLALMRFDTDHFFRFSSLAFSPDGSKLASGSTDDTIHLWDLATEKAEQIFVCQSTVENSSSEVRCVAFSADGSKLVSGSTDGIIRVWNMEDGQIELRLHDQSSSVASVYANLYPVLKSPTEKLGHEKFYSLNHSKTWVVQDGSKILLLPIDYTSHLVAVTNNAIAIGSATGRLVILYMP